MSDRQGSLCLVMGIAGTGGYQAVQYLRPALEGTGIAVVHIAANARALEELVPVLGADAVLFSHDLPGMTPELVREFLQQRERPVPAIGLFPPNRALTIARYHAAGMKGYLSLPLDVVQLQMLPGLIREAVDAAWTERVTAQAVEVP